MEKTFLINEALAFGWNEFWKRPWFFVGFFATAAGLSIFLSLLQTIMLAIPGNSVYFVGAFFTIIAFFLGALFRLGFFAVALTVQRGEEPHVSLLFSKYHFLPKFIITNVVYGIGIFLGCLLLIVPGVIIALRGSLFPLILLEENGSPWEALKKSFVLTKGYAWKLLLFFLSIVLLNIIGVLVFIVGVLVTVPITVLAVVYVYRQLHSLNSSTSSNIPITQ